MKSLLENQECRIDNHQAGQITQKLKGVHIHKTFKKNKLYSKAIIKIPLDGKNVSWQCLGENSNKLRKECERALSNPKNNKRFVDIVVKEMARYNNLEHDKNIDEKNKQIAERVLSQGFLIQDLAYQGIEQKKLFGKYQKYYIFAEDNVAEYKVFLGKTRFIIKGKVF